MLDTTPDVLHNIEIGEAKRFLSLLDRNSTSFTFAAIDDKKQGRQIKHFHGELAKYQDALTDLNRKGYGIFVCVNETDLLGKGKENIKRIRAVFSDNDAEYADGFPLPESMIVETSPRRYQHYWVVDGDWPCDSEGVRDFDETLARMVESYGHDKIAMGTNRLLRLPGFYHMKSTPQLVKLIHHSGDRYSKQTILERFPPLPKQTKTKPKISTIDETQEVSGQVFTEALKAIPSDDYDIWITACQGLHHWSNGGEDGFQIWDHWSAKSDKYKGVDDTRKTWDRFRCDHNNPITIFTVLKLAHDMGWDGSPHASLETPKVRQAEAIPAGSLAKRTMEKLRLTFAAIGHSPSAAQWEGLEDIASTMEAMLKGTAKEVVYLSSIDPGVGKTQTMVHFLKEWFISGECKNQGAIICLGRNEEIKTLIRQLKEGNAISDSDYAVVVAKDEELNALGNPDKNKARILITTQQRLERRSLGSDFNAFAEYHFNGRPRALRVWDEAIIPGRPVTVTIHAMQALMEHLIHDIPELHQIITSIVEDLEAAEDRETFEVPNLDEAFDKDAALSHFEGDKGKRRTIEDLYLLSGRIAVVRKHGLVVTALDYVETLSKETKPILVLDASGRVRATYTHWSDGRGDIVRLREAAKDYTNLTVHKWETAGGRAAWGYRHEEFLKAISELIETRPNEEWLVVHHRAVPKPVDKKVKKLHGTIPDALKAKLPEDVAAKLKFMHWGNHSVTLPPKMPPP